MSEVAYHSGFHSRIIDFIAIGYTKRRQTRIATKVFFVRSYRRSSGRWNSSGMRLRTSIEPLFNRVSVCNICGRSRPNYNASPRRKLGRTAKLDV